MKKILLIILCFYFGNHLSAQNLELSLLTKATKYKEIGPSFGYSIGYYKHLKENARFKLNLNHEIGKIEYLYPGFDQMQGLFETYIWKGNILHHNLMMKLQIDLDLTKSKKSNFYVGLNSTFGYTFLKYSGSKEYIDGPIKKDADYNKSAFRYPNIGVNFEYELVIKKHAFALYIEPAFVLFNNKKLLNEENLRFESICLGLVYRFRTEIIE